MIYYFFFSVKKSGETLSSVSLSYGYCFLFGDGIRAIVSPAISAMSIRSSSHSGFTIAVFLLHGYALVSVSAKWWSVSGNVLKKSILSHARANIFSHEYIPYSQNIFRYERSGTRERQSRKYSSVEREVAIGVEFNPWMYGGERARTWDRHLIRVRYQMLHCMLAFLARDALTASSGVISGGWYPHRVTQPYVHLRGNHRGGRSIRHLSHMHIYLGIFLFQLLIY